MISSQPLHHESGMELHIFDLDETLIAGDSGMLWHQFLVNSEIVTDKDFLSKDIAMMQLYAKGELKLEQYIAFSLKPIQRLHHQDVETLVKIFVKQYIPQIIYPEAKRLISDLSHRQQTILLISATLSFIVKEIAQQLHIKYHLGVDLEQVNQCYTPSIKGVASFREGKITRLQQWLQTRTEKYRTLHFYSDSINDQALLEYVDKPYVVNPCPKLQAVAKSKGWPEINWQISHQ